VSTHAVGRAPRVAVRVRHGLSVHWAWLAGSLAVAFALPFVLADVLELERDLYYGIYSFAVFGLVLAWARSTGYDLADAIRRRWPVAAFLGLAVAGLLALMVVRTEDATSRPEGLDLVAAVLWRGVLYGVADGLLLSAFPIVLVFAAFAGTRLNERFRGKLAIGLLAVLASFAMTAAYHAGYDDFRSGKIGRPLSGSLVWGVPTLVTLNPIGAPIAHAGVHVTAVLHSYETDVYLPPHR
jgi:hypothetical protein